MVETGKGDRLPITADTSSFSRRGGRLAAGDARPKRALQNKPTVPGSSGNATEDPGANGELDVLAVFDPVTELWCPDGWEWEDAAA